MGVEFSRVGISGIPSQELGFFYSVALGLVSAIMAGTMFFGWNLAVGDLQRQGPSRHKLVNNL